MKTRFRRLAVSVCCALSLSPFTRAFAAFDFDDVVRRAQELAKESFKDERGSVPEWLLELSYDQWRDIRFRPDRSLWRDKKLPFQVQFFHPGLYYDRTVKINVVDAQGVHPVPFSPSQFDYGTNDFASRVPQDLGYAGFRIHYPIKKPDYCDEVIVFLGASYFRAVGQGPRLRPLGARPRGRHRACRRARSSRTSASSGWCARRRTRRR